MRQELQDQLRAFFPEAFGSCEFNVGDGWFHLLNRVGYGLEYLKAGPASLVYSKFGALRVHNSLKDEHLREPVSSYLEDMHRLSKTLCEDCGTDGQGNDHYGYYKTTCPAHMLTTKRQQNAKQFAKDYPEVLETEKRRKRLVGLSVIYQGKTVYVDLNKESFAKHSESLGDLMAKLKEHGLSFEE